MSFVFVLVHICSFCVCFFLFLFYAQLFENCWVTDGGKQCIFKICSNLCWTDFPFLLEILESYLVEKDPKSNSSSTTGCWDCLLQGRQGREEVKYAFKLQVILNSFHAKSCKIDSVIFYLYFVRCTLISL